jgi:hypothetical protein
MRYRLAIYIWLSCHDCMLDQLDGGQKALCPEGFVETASTLFCPACQARELYVSQVFVSTEQTMDA